MDFRYARSFKERLLGLMFTKEVKVGLVLNNCRSIHTCFMRMDIGIVALDKNQRIVYQEVVSPFKFRIYPKSVVTICELPLSMMESVEKVIEKIGSTNE